MNDGELDGVKTGDQTLFARLVREHHRALIGIATPIVGRSETEEVVQNAWRKAHQSIEQFEGRAQIRTWLGRIVINEARMQLRKRKRESLFSDWLPEEDTAANDIMAERFDAHGRWNAPPIQWNLAPPEKRCCCVRIWRSAWRSCSTPCQPACRAGTA